MVVVSALLMRPPTPSPGDGRELSPGALVTAALGEPSLTQGSPMTARRILIANGEVTVDSEDIPLVLAYDWRITFRSTGLVAGVSRNYSRAGQSATQFLHRQILHPKSNVVVDHINGDPTDNRRANLRTCTHKQNLWNSAPRRAAALPYKGVRPAHAKSSSYEANICADGRTFYLGSHKELAQAARLYDAGARQLFGEFAWLNFPNDPAIPLPPSAQARVDQHIASRLSPLSRVEA